MKKLILIICFILLLLVNSNSIDPDKACKFANRVAICKICCCESPYSVRCDQMRLETEHGSPVVFHMNSSHFNGIQTLNYLIIDLTFSDYYIDLRIDPKLFTKMTNLKTVTLVKLTGLIKAPNFENQYVLEELTIRESDLKQIDPDFCYNNRNLKKIDLSVNNLETERLVNVFNNCEQLYNLDLSYNNLNSLQSMFTYVSSLVLLNLDHNDIEQIGNNDLDFLIDLEELSIANNRLRKIGEKAFFLKNLKKLDLKRNNLEYLEYMEYMEIVNWDY